MKREVALVLFLVLAMGALLVWYGVSTSSKQPGESLFADYVPQSLHKTWTITGSPGSPNLAFVDPTGAVQPRRDAYSVRCFIFDRQKRQLYSPLLRNVCSRAMLANGITPSVTWQANGVRCTQSTFASSDVCYSSVLVRNESRAAKQISLFVAALPYQVIGPMQAGFAVECDLKSGAVVVDGKVLLVSETRPAYAGAVSGAESGDITGYLRKGLLPRRNSVRGDISDGSGAIRFDIDLSPRTGTELRFRMPMTGVSVREWKRRPMLQVEDASAEYRRRWAERLGRVSLQLPDQRVTDCFNASLAYLVMLCGSGKPVPGPAKYHSFWVRDAAYMADALYHSGQTELIPPALKQLRAMQLPDGAFLAKTRGNADELDAPGEAIYALVQNYRRTGDMQLLRDDWPVILSACRYIRAKRVGPDGILPASVSAEDLGRGDQQHYWDHFWCVRGLRDAAFAASELGKSKDAAWIAAEAESLLRATLASVREAKARHSIDYIPNGPEEVTSSAMARGTSCALWPCAVLELDDPLTKSSFDTYWDKWIAPSEGGFVHKDHFWPYAGLDLAQGYLMLGQRERVWKMLDWTLNHDATRGFYSWPEGMFREDLTLAEGDMPHGWMCASYVSLVRNMLVRESGNELVLLSGVPEHWLRPGLKISVKSLPTEFGTVSYTVEVGQTALKLTFSGAKPTRICRIILPKNREMTVPAGTGDVTIPLR